MSLIDEIKEDFEKIGRKIEQLEKKYEAPQKEVEPKKWEPEGGDWYVASSGKVGEEESDKGCHNFGMERKKEEQAIAHRNRLYAFNMCWAYIDQNMHRFQSKDSVNAYLLYDYGAYEASHQNNENLSIIDIYGPHELIQELADKINSGEIDLEHKEDE